MTIYIQNSLHNAKTCWSPVSKEYDIFWPFTKFSYLTCFLKKKKKKKKKNPHGFLPGCKVIAQSTCHFSSVMQTAGFLIMQLILKHCFAQSTKAQLQPVTYMRFRLLNARREIAV